jgi:hypothetical protein
MQTHSEFHYAVTVGTANDTYPINTTLSLGDGWDDASVNAFVQVLRDFPWPTAARPVQVSGGKVTITTDTYSSDLSTTPPTFV